MTPQQSFLTRLSNAPTAITLFSVCLILLLSVNLLDFPASVPYMKKISGEKYLDMQVFYTADQAYILLEKFGPEGRKMQRLLLSTIDVFIPLFAGLAGITMISFLFRKNERFKHLHMIAIGASLTDYMENLGIFILIVNYPQRLNAVAQLTGILTFLKGILYVLTILIVLAGIAYRIYLNFSNKKRGLI